MLPALVALNLAALGYSAWAFRQKQALYRAFQEGTAEAYAGLLERAGHLRDRVLVNLGNRYFDEGLRSGGLGGVRKAIAYYREALRLNPDLMEAKKNFEVANRFLETQVETRQPRRPMEIERIRPSQLPLQPHDI